MPTAPIAILKTGSAIDTVRDHGDFEDWMAAGLGAEVPVQVCDISEGEVLPDPATISGVVITGSSAMVTDRKHWSEACAHWLAEVVPSGLPVLGVCYGHQLLAHALGGRVDRDPNGREIGTQKIIFNGSSHDDPLFAGLTPTFLAQTTHTESVLELPADAIPLARSEHTAVHAFRWGRHAWGVQFHPEFDGELMRAYIQARADDLRAEGFDPDHLVAQVVETPEAASVLARFAALVTV